MNGWAQSHFLPLKYGAFNEEHHVMDMDMATFLIKSSGYA